MAHSPHAVTGSRLGLTILINAAITVVELIGGLLTGYLALIADAIHNLSDVAALVLAWFGEKGARRPPTKRSTYGLKRLEVMTALFSAFSLVVIAFVIFQEAYRRFMAPEPLRHPALFLAIAAFGLVGNLTSVWLLHTERKKSLNLKTAFLHLAFDTLSSIVVLIGGIVILQTGWTRLDPILSAVIGVMILWSAYNVIREGALILLEAVPAGVEFDQVHAAILRVPRVRDVHDLHIWSLSSRDLALSCHVCLQDSDLASGPEVVAVINRTLLGQFGIGHTTVQIESADCGRTDLLCCDHQADTNS